MRTSLILGTSSSWKPGQVLLILYALSIRHFYGTYFVKARFKTSVIKEQTKMCRFMISRKSCYIGKTCCQFITRIDEHIKKDKKSHVF